MEIIVRSPDLFQFVVEPKARPATGREEADSGVSTDECLKRAG
jgi:hypothetical protein